MHGSGTKRPTRMNKSILAAIMLAGQFPQFRVRVSGQRKRNDPDREKTGSDLQRMDAAEEKRKRKASR